MSRFSKLAASIRLLSSTDPNRVHHRLTSGGLLILAASYFSGIGKAKYGSNSCRVQPASAVRPAPGTAAATACVTRATQPTLRLTPFPPFQDTMEAPVTHAEGPPTSPPHNLEATARLHVPSP